jgi:hypothetical protein
MPLQSLIPVSASIEDVFNQITSAGIDKADAATLVGNWILETAGQAPRVFNYQTEFDETDPEATSQFVRSFVHVDWGDGRDPVQAEQTSSEDGFNLRFHRIEADLDSLARDVATAFVALAEQRSALRHLLDEIRAEINITNTTLSNLTAPSRPTFPGGVVGGVKTGTFVGATSFFGQPVNVFQTDQGQLMLPGISGIQVDPADNPRVQRVDEFAKFLTDDRVTQLFAQAGTVNRDKFNEAFGNEQLDSGAKVRDVIDILPSQANFSTPQAMLDGLAAREGAAIRTSPVEGEAITATLGADAGTAVADVPLDRLETIPASGRTALLDAGIVKLGDLAGKDPSAVATDLQSRGVDVTARDVAGWVGVAKTLVQIG